MASSGNFCTYNPLPYSTNFRTGLQTNTYSGLKNVGNTLSFPGNNCMGFGTIALTTGKKWYMEGIANNVYNTTMGIFEVNDANTIQNNLNTFYYNNTSYKSAFYHADGTKYVDGSNSSYGASFSIGDIIGMAVDLESATNTITFYKNNSSQGSFNLGTNGLDYLFCVARGTSGGAFFMNWGQDSTYGGLKTAGGNADDNGFGDFFYAPPSGHLALCSGNLGISDDIDPAQTDDDIPTKQCGVVTYTGTGSATTISGLGLQPDLIWAKTRSTSSRHYLVDSSRGFTKYLHSEDNYSEGTSSTGVTSANSDGFVIGGGLDYVNYSSRTYVAWCWRANGGVTQSNSNGAITSTVQANVKAGFSIVQWTANATSSVATTVGHGLSKAPEFVITKSRDSSTNWCVTHTGLSSTSHMLFLNSNAVETDKSGNGNMSANTSTVFSVNATDGSNAPNTDSMIAYCWHSVEGYSKFGKYEGNANTDGAFVYTGFRIRILIIRVLNVASDGWLIYDTERETFNPLDTVLKPHDETADYSNSAFTLDILSNGFKLRSSDNAVNGTSYDPYIYMAWGDVPFKYNNTF